MESAIAMRHCRSSSLMDSTLLRDSTVCWIVDSRRHCRRFVVVAYQDLSLSST